LARQLAERDLDAVVVAGGDGTINEVVNGLQGCNTALGIIPCGTANDLAYHLSIPKNVEEACAVILRCQTRRIDLLRANGWFLATTGGLGVGCEVIRLVERIKSNRVGRRVAATFGATLYLLVLILAGMRRQESWCRLGIGNGPQDVQFPFFSLTVSNIPRLARHFQLAPEASDQDGRAHLCCIRSAHGLLALLRSILETLNGSPGRGNNVKLAEERQFQISCERATAFFGDGVLREPSDRFELKVVPAAVAVLVPDAVSGARQ
jgi:diacylglycerol kinase family enzyme